MKKLLKNSKKQLKLFLKKFGLVKTGYWQQRTKHLYYKKIVEIVNEKFDNCNSVIDVGSSNTEILKQFTNIKNKTALDKKNLPSIPDINTVHTDFLEYEIVEKFDLVLCLQVLEHLENPKEFTQKLFSLGENIIISVPYKWKKNQSIYHLQDPVDEDKLKSWTDTDPDELFYITESDKTERVIALYYAKD